MNIYLREINASNLLDWRARKTIQHFLQLHSRTLFSPRTAFNAIRVHIFIRGEIIRSLHSENIDTDGNEMKNRTYSHMLSDRFEEEVEEEKKKNTSISMRTNSDPIQ